LILRVLGGSVILEGMEQPSTNAASECPRCRELEARLLELETRLRDLEDRLKPPTPRPVGQQPAAPAKRPTGKKRGAQPGHPPHLKKRLPPDRVSTVVTYIPHQCEQCDQLLPAQPQPHDPPPTIHQVAELPQIAAEVTEYQGHFRTCSCGHVSHTPIPAEIRAHSIGPKLAGTIVYFSGCHGLSKRGIEETVETLFGVPIALGTIAKLEQEASAALEGAYRQVRHSVANAEVKHLDETGWKEAGKKRWLWVAATVKAVLFLIHPRRNWDALKLLLGKLAGILVSDRWNVYDHWDCDLRQLCWAHVRRNWEKQIERGGKAKELGESWLAVQKQVFELWHQFRGGGCTRAQMQERMLPHIEALGDILDRGQRCGDARLVGYCRRLLERYPLLWLFVCTFRDVIG
jgi:transposase